MTKDHVTAAFTALAPAIWGSTYLVTEEWLPPDRPLLAATVRVLPAGLFLIALSRTLPSGVWWWRALVVGAFNVGGLNYLLFVAAYRLPGGVAAMMMSVQPMLTLLLAAALLGDRIRPRQVVACLLGVAGVALLVLQGTSSLDPVGVAAALGAAGCMAAGITLTKRWGRPDGVGLSAFTGWQLAAGGVVLLPFTLGLEGLPATVGATNVMGFGYLIVFGAVISYGIWFRGIERLSASAVGFLALGSPIVATLLGFVFRGETLSVAQMIGVVVIVSAVVLAQLPARATSGAASPLPDAAPARVVP